MTGKDIVKHELSDLAPVGGPIVVSAAEAIEVQSTWLHLKEQELERMLEARAALKALGGHESRLARLADRVQLTRKVIAALRAGFVPIPRFDAHKLNPDVDVLPTRVLVAYAAAQNTELFDEVRLVEGRQSRSHHLGPNPRIAARDPLLVGIVRTPEREGVTRWGGRTWIPGREEHFLVAWWRPEDDRDEDLF